MKNNRDFDPGSGEIFVSKDGYVIDGHHRWAAQVARDYEDGKGGDLNMKVRVVDMPIMDVLKEANSWADDFGIMPKEAKA
jgi:ParB-like chromosome segregation protein Spo0J